MRFSTFATLLFSLTALASPITTPIEAELSTSQSGYCSIIVGFGSSVPCHQAPDERSPAVYKFSTQLYTTMECFTTSNGSGWYRTKSPNGICMVKESDIAEGALCRAQILGVIC